MSLLLGYDIGSSSVKATLLEAGTGKVIASSTSPKTELKIIAKKEGWAEQEPDTWWEHVINVTKEIKQKANVDLNGIEAIGIAYQMHGLVIVDKNQKVLYPSIIWCDSRAVEIGDKAFSSIGREKCQTHLLNSPGNFTASRIKWVKDNLSRIYKNIYKVMLPGDYIAMKLTGEINTTVSGISEYILWDFKENKIADIVLDYFDVDKNIIPDVVSTFSVQGELSKKAASELGLKPGIKISYRAGDQPNNAFSLNVLNPGEIAATAGTSGVVYGVTDKNLYDDKSRVNIFVHVNNSDKEKRHGILMCISSTGILNSWIKNNFFNFKSNVLSYDEMNKLASEIKPGSEKLFIIPFGNGAERTLENKNINASIHGLNLNIHTGSHVLRAAQEGIVFAFNFGLNIMSEMGLKISKIRAGYSNMFLSPIFQKVLSSLSNLEIELYNTDGSQGAARGAGIGSGIYKNYNEAFLNLKVIKNIKPDKNYKKVYNDVYQDWLNILRQYI